VAKGFRAAIFDSRFSFASRNDGLSERGTTRSLVSLTLAISNSSLEHSLEGPKIKAKVDLLQVYPWGPFLEGPEKP